MLPDIYFDAHFGKLYEEIEHGTAECFHFSCALGTVQHQFILREIPDAAGYYDIVTPYGYGGPLITECNGDRAALAEQFGNAFGAYCKEKNIVSEFVRFHPIVNNQADFRNLYETIYLHHTVGTDIAGHEDPVQEEFSKSCRKNIRQALRKGVTCRVTVAPEHLDSFIPIYYDTMQRDGATDYYYFPPSYFETCLQYYRDHILLVEAIYEEQVIAAGFYFVYNDILQTHLSGTRKEFLFLSPAYLLRYTAANWAKEHGIRVIHHGGGTNDAPDNSLYLFKKQFTRGTEFDFYIGKKIWDEPMYDQLCVQKQIDRSTISYFPQYRANKPTKEKSKRHEERI